MDKIKFVAIEDLKPGMFVTDTKDTKLTEAEVNEQYDTEKLPWYRVLNVLALAGVTKLTAEVRGKTMVFRVYESLPVWVRDESETLSTITMLNDASDEFVLQESAAHALQDTPYSRLVRIEAAFRNMG